MPCKHCARRTHVQSALAPRDGLGVLHRGDDALLEGVVIELSAVRVDAEGAEDLRVGQLVRVGAQRGAHGGGVAVDTVGGWAEGRANGLSVHAPNARLEGGIESRLELLHRLYVELLQYVVDVAVRVNIAARGDAVSAFPH